MDRMFKMLNNAKTMVHCETREQAKIFIDLCYQNGFEWSCSDMCLHWNCYGHKTCYIIENNYIKYGRIDGCCVYTHTVIPFKDFMKEYSGTNEIYHLEIED